MRIVVRIRFDVVFNFDRRCPSWTLSGFELLQFGESNAIRGFGLDTALTGSILAAQLLNEIGGALLVCFELFVALHLLGFEPHSFALGLVSCLVRAEALGKHLRGAGDGVVDWRSHHRYRRRGIGLDRSRRRYDGRCSELLTLFVCPVAFWHCPLTLCC